MNELIPLSFHKIMQSRAYTVIILGAEQKRFAIYTEPHVGNAIQLQLNQGHPPRPLTHDLLNHVLKGLNVKILQVVINHVEETVYYARLFLEQQLGDQKQILEIDARPSDCIMLALMHQVPLFCPSEVLEKALPIQD